MQLTDAEKWAMVVARDRAADASFCFSVKTTGVYCRPSCGARRPRRENVAFHATWQAAERAGFRPCRRCRPNQAPRAAREAALVARACRSIERSLGHPEAPLRLRDLAAQAGLSASHFSRLFKAATGLPPGAYAAAQRGQRVRAQLGRSRTVTAAAYEAGFNSSGRFYAASNRILGMTPSAFRAGGENAEIRYAVGASSLGAVMAARSQRGVCAILLGGDPARLVGELRKQFPNARLLPAQRGFRTLLAKVVRLVECPGLGLDLPLDIRGTAFQQRVWDALRRIPAGATASYAEVARKLGRPRAARAVAQACAANGLAVAIPCHRVVGSGGALSGYRWGLARKRALLAREALPLVTRAE